MGGWTKTGSNTWTSDKGDNWTKTGSNTWTNSDGRNVTKSGNTWWKGGSDWDDNDDAPLDEFDEDDDEE